MAVARWASSRSLALRGRSRIAFGTNRARRGSTRALPAVSICDFGRFLAFLGSFLPTGGRLLFMRPRALSAARVCHVSSRSETLDVRRRKHAASGLASSKGGAGSRGNARDIYEAAVTRAASFHLSWFCIEGPSWYFLANLATGSPRISILLMSDSPTLAAAR